MKSSLVFLALIGIFLIAFNNVDGRRFSDNIDQQEVLGFVKSFNDLQREPPAPPSVSRATVQTSWITQKVNHFDASNSRTWQMRYMVNDEFFKTDGPLFIYLGGEWEISSGMISGGHMYDMAKEHNGMLYYTEHRYYGASRPTADFSTSNLQYLHVKQALADLAHFIRSMRAINKNSKVIITGGSYSATMVVWFKRLYPDLVEGGWASSAPILAKTDFLEYKEVVGRAMKELGSQQCYNRIQNGVAGLEQMFAERRGAEVRAMLKICSNFNENNDLDMWSLFSSISNIFAGIVQYQREGDVPYYCNYLMGFDDDVVALTNFINWRMGNPQQCINYAYQSTVNYYRVTSFLYGASRPWYYQTCNEYGWYQSSASPDQPFGTQFPATLYITLCGDVFGSTYSNGTIHSKVRQTNDDFGGMKPDVSNVYMTHGALDPWHPMGHGEEQGAVLIPRTSHCQDFGSVSASDSYEMRNSKLRLAELVREWLA